MDAITPNEKRARYENFKQALACAQLGMWGKVSISLDLAEMLSDLAAAELSRQERETGRNGLCANCAHTRTDSSTVHVSM